MFVIRWEIVTKFGTLKMEIRNSRIANIGTYCHCKTHVAISQLNCHCKTHVALSQLTVTVRHTWPARNLLSL